MYISELYGESHCITSLVIKEHVGWANCLVVHQTMCLFSLAQGGLAVRQICEYIYLVIK